MRKAEISIGEIIRNRRVQLGLTQGDVATSSAIPLRTYQGIETGKSEPGFGSLRAIAKTLNLSTEDLWGEVGPPRKVAASAVHGPLTAGDCAAILEQLEKVSPYKRALALTVLFEDPTLFDSVDVPEELPDSLQALLRVR